MAKVLGAIDKVGRELRDGWDVAFKDSPPSPRALGSVAAVIAGLVLIALFEAGVARWAATGVVLLISAVALIELWTETRRRGGHSDTEGDV